VSSAIFTSGQLSSKNQETKDRKITLPQMPKVVGLTEDRLNRIKLLMNSKTVFASNGDNKNYKDFMNAYFDGTPIAFENIQKKF
jgi:hypothetical protein